MPTNEGLFSKYHVRTPDEKPLDSGTFVLRPFNADGSVRDRHAIAALHEYAESCHRDNYELSGQILNWLNERGENEATQTLNVPPEAS